MSTCQRNLRYIRYNLYTLINIAIKLLTRPVLHCMKIGVFSLKYKTTPKSILGIDKVIGENNIQRSLQ